MESNFNTLLESFLSVFIVLANNGWTKVYFTHQRFLEPFSTSLYFISLVLLGQFVLLNLVIAIIIENFEFQSVKNDLVSKLTDMNGDDHKLDWYERIFKKFKYCNKKRRLKIKPKDSSVSP